MIVIHARMKIFLFVQKLGFWNHPGVEALVGLALKPFEATWLLLLDWFKCDSPNVSPWVIK